MWYYLGGEHFGFFDFESDFDHRSEMSQARWLEDRALAAKKKVVGLQSDREHFDVYYTMPLDEQADMLRERLDRYNDSSDRVPIARFYLDGDLARLHALWHEYLSWLRPATAQTLDDNMVNKRNRVMVDRMLPLMRDRQSFIAVGALHLTGEEGVLRILEQRGFTVTRLL